MIRLTESPMTWVATGDSITQAVLHTHGARGWVEHVHERIRWQLNRPTDIVVNTGVSGWGAADVLAVHDHLIGRFDPDVLSVSLGTNDCIDGEEGLPGFHEAMRRIIARAAPRTQVVLHTPVLVGLAGRERRASLPAYCRAVREIAKDTGALLVDHEAHWLEHHGTSDPISWLDDAAHPNAVGHLRMANHTLRTLGLGELNPL
ncbi:SGNH/GDSL hydrolase family protein [Streptomyces sp. ZAF1911]|uniref:SGNH/GDSL hydrolase family protein n=1 Tax=Streptomyces sp. ZAF1911 TaxID=2944129 RepID=UPI00237C059D|nr:SGNH/GDSL hydrolase family protein [Streptomyces sp. ZAF1911]MDD9375231.1 SGNH/GDSL hydrolase family protein [Streptomyces sp. ZAF1911]